MREFFWLAAGGAVLLLLYGGWRLYRQASDGLRSLEEMLRAFGLGARGYSELMTQTVSRQPRSLTAMTGLSLPEVQRDFPEFGWPETVQRAENLWGQILAALSAGDETAPLEGASPELREQLARQIAAGRQAGQSPRYERVKFHRTELSHYEKGGGACRLVIQSAAEFLYTGPAGGEKAARQLTQARLELEYCYIQDPALYEKAGAGGSLGLRCPNCGAPVTALGAKVCPYCHGALREVNDRVWAFNRYAID